MKLARFSAGGPVAIGLIDGEAVTDLSKHIPGLPTDMAELIARWDEFVARIAPLKGRADLRLDEVRLHAPIRRPGKVMAIGLNYADHVAESGLTPPAHQLWFSKASSSVTGPSDPIQKPRVSDAIDYEAELVVVIGKGGRHVPREKAKAAIFGYCVGNDVSVRDWQLRTPQFTLGKSFDTHAPIGPWIVTADEIDPDHLGIRAFVNGEKRQDSNTKHLIFDVAAQIETLSQAMTLEPGDIIFTGTPGGVGMAMKPPNYLKAGDTVRIEIDGLGALDNPVVAEA
jgi:2-keto-4-pentenoate hydratase/2-oxohepta-3-ene-1,7-dioic acid hydratase in catechol pathway